jgi:hypothetical protein
MIELSGQVFGRWVVKNKAGVSKHRETLWNCVCICGNKKAVGSYSLRYGTSKSCGCYKHDGDHIKKQIKTDTAFTALFNTYKRSAKEKKLEFNLSKDQLKILTSSSCAYCGCEPHTIKKTTSKYSQYVYNGIDRKNNNLGYILSNCVTCCKDCNYAKQRMTLPVFAEWVAKVYNHMWIILKENHEAN